MISFREPITKERLDVAFKIANKRLFISKILWSVVFGILLITFLLLTIINNGDWWMYVILGAMIIVIVYVNFLNDFVFYKLKQKKLDESKEEIFLSIDFNSEHIAVTNPLNRKPINRIDYSKLAYVFFDEEKKVLFFLMKGDSAYYFTMFLEDEAAEDIKEALEMFDTKIINQEQLEAQLGLKIERDFVDDVYYENEINEETKDDGEE